MTMMPRTMLTLLALTPMVLLLRLLPLSSE